MGWGQSCRAEQQHKQDRTASSPVPTHWSIGSFCIAAPVLCNSISSVVLNRHHMAWMHNLGVIPQWITSALLVSLCNHGALSGACLLIEITTKTLLLLLPHQIHHTRQSVAVTHPFTLSLLVLLAPLSAPAPCSTSTTVLPKNIMMLSLLVTCTMQLPLVQVHLTAAACVAAAVPCHAATAASALSRGCPCSPPR